MTQTSTLPALSNATKNSGPAGQYEYAVDVAYPGEDAGRVAFVANIYGGPVVVVTACMQTFVSSDVTDRIGTTLTEAWLLRFFGLDPETARIA